MVHGDATVPSIVKCILYSVFVLHSVVYMNPALARAFPRERTCNATWALGGGDPGPGLFRLSASVVERFRPRFGRRLFWRGGRRPRPGQLFEAGGPREAPGAARGARGAAWAA